MRPMLLAWLWLAVAAPVAAQAQAVAPAPVVVPPATAAPAGAPDQPPAAPLPAPTPAPPLPSWQPRQAAVLQALDKVDGGVATLTIPVGSSQDYRNISIAVRSCYARPPDQAQDATAFVVIADKAPAAAVAGSAGPAAPAFSGWLLAAEPAASMMEHPVYDVRVLGCR